MRAGCKCSSTKGLRPAQATIVAGTCVDITLQQVKLERCLSHFKDAESLLVPIRKIGKLYFQNFWWVTSQKGLVKDIFH